MISRRSIITVATIIMLGNVFSRLLGVVREQVIAGMFGATAATSAFAAAATVPSMVYDLLIGGALTAALIPVFSEYAREDQNDDLWSLSSTVMILGGIALAVIAVVLVVFARPLVSFLVGGLPAEEQSQAIGMVQVVLPGVIFFGLSGIVTAVLYARQAVLFPAFSVACYNLGIIVCAVLFSGVLGITSLVIGIVIGSLFQLVILIPGLRKIGFRFHLNFHHPALKRILLLYAPVALGIVVSEIGVLIDRNFASYTGDDSIAVMRYATTLVQLPVGMVAMAISYAILPALSRYANERMSTKSIAVPAMTVEQGASSTTSDDPDNSFKSTLVMGMRLALLVMLPATVGLVVLRVPIIQLLFQHGVFDVQSTERTALAFLAYAPQLPFLPIDYLLIFAFYARKNTVTPVIVGVISVGVYLVVALSLMEPLGMVGLCLANTAQNSFHAIILLVLLLKTMGSLRGFGLWSTLLRIVAAAGMMGAVVMALLDLLVRLVGLDNLMSQAVVIAISVVVGVAVYAVAISVMRIEEAGALRRALARRLSPSNNSASPTA